MCGDKHMTVRSLTSGYFEMKVAICCNFGLFPQYLAFFIRFLGTKVELVHLFISAEGMKNSFFLGGEGGGGG